MKSINIVRKGSLRNKDNKNITIINNISSGNEMLNKPPHDIEYSILNVFLLSTKLVRNNVTLDSRK